MFEDGIKWIKDVDEASLDLIIIDSTDPIGPAEGLFSQDFYEDCFRALHSSGILVQQSESPLYHMGILTKIHKDMRGAGFADAKTLHYPQPLYPSGWWSATMASKDNAINGFREADARNKTFATRYYNVDIHKAALAQPEFCREAGLG